MKTAEWVDNIAISRLRGVARRRKGPAKSIWTGPYPPLLQLGQRDILVNPIRPLMPFARNWSLLVMENVERHPCWSFSPKTLFRSITSRLSSRHTSLMSGWDNYAIFMLCSSNLSSFPIYHLGCYWLTYSWKLINCAPSTIYIGVSFPNPSCKLFANPPCNTFWSGTTFF